MCHRRSNGTKVPRSFQSEDAHAAKEPEKKKAYADLNEACRRKISELEKAIARETGEEIVLIAYRI